MKTFIKTIRTITAVLMILAGLTVLFIIDNANDLMSLLTLAVIMVTGVVGGIAILVTTYPSLLDLSEFDDKSLKSLEDCQKELELLREHNLLLTIRYAAFKNILKSSSVINDSNKDKFPTLYRLVYEEDLTNGVITVNEGSLEQIDKVK